MSARTFIYIGWIIIAAPAAAQVVVFEEDFDGAGAPVGWTLEDGWILSTSTPSSGSGLSSLQHKGNAATNAVTPAISLSGAVSATLTYLVRRTGAYGTDNLVVRGSADGGQSFTVTLLDAGSAVPADDSNWETISTAIPPELLGSSDVVLQFAGQGLYASSATVRIDDVAIAADVALEVAPLSLSFTALRGASETKSISAVNRTAEVLTIGAPVLTGADFSIAPSGAVVLGGGATQVYDITFTAATQGQVVGSAHLTYGSGSADVALTGTGSGGLLSFSEPSSSAVENEIGVAVPLRLAFTSPEGLQGLQFRVTWSGDALSVGGVERGAAISSTSEWSLSYEARQGYVDVVLLGEGTASLGSGTYDDLLSILFDVGAGASSSSLALQNVIGALAEPNGSDADILASADAHVLTIGAESAFFQASSTALDLGAIPAGESASTTLVVSNPGGTSDLVVNDVTTSNPLFSVTPSTAQIAPEGQADFGITFAPTSTSFGLQTAEITFTHNGEGGSAVISLTGTGLGGRGDVEGDGIVDVLDIIYAIDFSGVQGLIAYLVEDCCQGRADLCGESLAACCTPPKGQQCRTQG